MLGSVVVCAPLGAVAPPGPQNGASARSEAEWQNRFQSLRASLPGFRVESVSELERIDAYYEAFLTDGRVVHAFQTANRERIPCVAIASQRSFLASGLPGTSPRLAPVGPLRAAGAAEVKAESSAADIGRQFRSRWLAGCRRQRGGVPGAHVPSPRA